MEKMKKNGNVDTENVDTKDVDTENVDTKDVDKRKVLFHTIASAATSLPPPDTSILRKEASGFYHILWPLHTRKLDHFIAVNNTVLIDKTV